MAGYRTDYSMSNNAFYAYQSGEMPLSKWTKDAMLTAIKSIANDENINTKMQQTRSRFSKRK